MVTITLSYAQMIIRRIVRKVPASGGAHSLRWFFLVVFLLGFGTALIFGIRFYRECSRLIDTHLNSQKWSLPSTIYADAPVLYQGMPIKISRVVEYLQRLDYQKALSADPDSGEYSSSKNEIRFQKHSLFPKLSQSFPVEVKFVDGGIERMVNLKTGEEIPALELEPIPISNLFGEEWEKRTLIRYKDLPDHLVQAVLSIEDRRFFSHGGIDLKAIARAVVNDIFNRKQLQGGSTITQQLVKNFYLTPERSVRRKISEAMMAKIMESRLKKEEILELYLNEIYLGQRGSMSINGIGEASRLFFRKEAKYLSVPESALLAGMIQAPNSYNPYRNPKSAKQRRDTVLRTMVETGALSKKEAEQYIATPISVLPYDDRINLAPYFGSLVKTQLLEKYEPSMVYSKNLHIFTTLDLEMQQFAEEAVAQGLERINKMRMKTVRKPVEGCLIAIEPQTGYIRAFVGGRSYSNSQFDRIRQAARQPGSVFKPVVYATAFEQAFQNETRIFTPATLVTDEPWTLKFSNQTWQPKNYDGQYHGTVTLRTALAHSMNVATAKLAVDVGLNQISLLAKRLGFGDVKPYPSLALGAFEVSPWQVANAYTVFANGGVKTELRTLEKVVDASGKVLERSKIEVKKILHPQTAYLITNMLESVMTEGTGASVRRSGFVRPSAGKTGTTDEYRDAWFVGYTPNLLCVVWTGYDDNTPIKMTGAQAALPIWTQFMKKATESLPEEDFSSPQGVTIRMIDPSTGGLATESCPRSVAEMFIEGTEPLNACSEHDKHWWNIFG